MILFKMLSRGVICEINGCISTGKEVRGHSSVHADQRSLIYWPADQCVTAALCVCVHQANVYHANTSAGENRAIKIYKTSILLFKDRDKYVSGEFRWAAHHRRRVYQSQI